MKFIAALSALGLFLSACASMPVEKFNGEGISLSTSFESGKADNISQGPGGYTLTITPENTPINDSPWYAFDIIGAKGKTVPITLSYQDGTHRYSPKIQKSDGTWEKLMTSVDVSEDETIARFTVTPKSDVVKIAAQPIIDTQDHMAWIEKMSALDFVSAAQIGASVEDRPIYKLEEIDAPNDDKPYVVIIGRQHPPELTGAEALMPFVETVWGNSELAQKFRAAYNLIVIPLMNPDGVARGHWRHNVGGIDLNRDWGPFTQPETQAAEKEFKRFKSGEDDIVLFLDFHSTWRNLIYTQTDEEPTTPAFFTRDWINNIKAVLPNEVYSFTREANTTTERPVSKNYMYHTYGIPAMTFEVGDDTPPEATVQASKVFAREMMALLLETAP